MKVIIILIAGLAWVAFGLPSKKPIEVSLDLREYLCQKGTGVYVNISGATTTIKSLEDLQDKTRFKRIECVKIPNPNYLKNVPPRDNINK